MYKEKAQNLIVADTSIITNTLASLDGGKSLDPDEVEAARLEEEARKLILQASRWRAERTVNGGQRSVRGVKARDSHTGSATHRAHPLMGSKNRVASRQSAASRASGSETAR